MGKSKDYLGRVHIGKAQSNVRDDYVRIAIRCAAWDRPLTVELSMEQFSGALFGAESDCVVCCRADE